MTITGTQTFKYQYSSVVRSDGVFQALPELEIDSHGHSGNPMEVPAFLLNDVVMPIFLAAAGGTGNAGRGLGRQQKPLRQVLH